MKDYLIVCTLSIILFSLLENMLIKGKFFKIIKSLFSIICILLISYPIINLLTNNYGDINVNFDENYTNHLISIEENTVELEVENIIKKSGYMPKNIEVIAQNDNGYVTVKKIKVIIDGEVIIENNEHINITKQVQNLLKDNCYNCELEVLIEG